ncbi:MAG: tRNA preQ1(34) S-adenosylmethionine ribosyltransferase-isomerase QueA [Betaproteobacteria bacterium]|nr:tRNA preQ1(34) S-adenosylmethionine ribosyltransferase-isomerase QueA [Betaproteobacteria bacterium]
MGYRLSDFDFELPPDLIAQVPSAQRSGSRLLHVVGTRLADRAFTDLPSLLRPGDLLVLNDTRVIHARVRAEKSSGGKVELLLERMAGPREAWSQLRASHPPKPGAVLRLPGGAAARVLAREGRFYRLAFDVDADLPAWLARHGEVPLPPYIGRQARREDDARYQTVYARAPGAVAAPTAGLHFDEAMFAALAARGVERAFVTLHVGAGTFQPVQAEDLALHRMHAEWYELPQATVDAVAATRARRGRVVAVGTTSLRALESAALADGTLRAGAAETSLFVTPGFRFRIVDRLLTNFHLPRSTLLMLVSAFAGFDAIRAAYAHAIAARYRFYSYGDALLLERGPGAAGAPG